MLQAEERARGAGEMVGWAGGSSDHIEQWLYESYWDHLPWERERWSESLHPRNTTECMDVFVYGLPELILHPNHM